MKKTASKKAAPKAKKAKSKGWGGARPGAGRPRSSERVPHTARVEISGRSPVEVTLKTIDEAGNLREKTRQKAIKEAIEAASDKGGFKITRHDVERSKVTLVVKADDADTLKRGLQGLQIRIARALNSLIGRSGRIFADRYEAKELGKRS